MNTEALNFGSYNGYIWSAYGLTLIALITMTLIARSAAKRELKNAQRRIQVGQSANQTHQGATP